MLLRTDLSLIALALDLGINTGSQKRSQNSPEKPGEISLNVGS